MLEHLRDASGDEEMTPKGWLGRADYVYLKPGDRAQYGDEYTDGNAVFVVGTRNTDFPKVGEEFTDQHVCYNPRRKK